METGTSDSICGTYNLFSDYIAFDVFVPLSGSPKQVCYQFPGESEVCVSADSYSIDAPFWTSNQCPNKEYILILDIYNDRYGNNGVTRFYPVWTDLLFDPNLSTDFGTTRILSLENRPNTSGFNGGVFATTLASGDTIPLTWAWFPNSAMWDWRYRNPRLVRKDGSSEATNLMQCGASSYLISLYDSSGTIIITDSGNSEPAVRIIPPAPCRYDLSRPTFSFGHLRTLPGSRVAVANFDENGRKGVRVIEYYLAYSSPPVPSSLPSPYQYIIGEVLSPVGCSLYPRIQWECDGKCFDKKCPPETCLKLKDGDSICCISSEGIVLATVPSECESSDCSCL